MSGAPAFSVPPDGLIRDETGAQRLIGYVLDVSVGDGTGRCVLEVDARHTNRSGVLHGGLISALLDNAMGIAASRHAAGADLIPFLTISMTTQYLAPARLGDTVTATGRVTGGERAIRFLTGDLRSSAGVLIAEASGVYKPNRGAVL